MRPLHIKLGDKFPQRLKDEAASLERLSRLGIHVFEESSAEAEISTAPIPAQVQKNGKEGDKSSEAEHTDSTTLLQENVTMTTRTNVTEVTTTPIPANSTLAPAAEQEPSAQQASTGFQQVSANIHHLDGTMHRTNAIMAEANALKSRDLRNAAVDLYVDAGVGAVGGIAGGVTGFFKGGRTLLSTAAGSLIGTGLTRPMAWAIQAVLRSRLNNK